RGVEDLALEDGPPERVDPDLPAGQERAEVAPSEGVDRRRVAQALQGTGAESGPVGIDEEEGPVLLDGSAEGEAPALVVEGTLGRRKEALGVERVVGEIAVGASAHAVRARLGRVLDEAAARMTVLGGVGRADDPDLLDGLHGWSALV